MTPNINAARKLADAFSSFAAGMNHKDYSVRQANTPMPRDCSEAAQALRELAAEVERLRIERDYLLHKVEDYQKPPVRVEGGNATVRIISGSVSADRVTDAMRGEP